MHPDNGTKPSDLPVEQPMKFELIIRMRSRAPPGIDVQLHCGKDGWIHHREF